MLIRSHVNTCHVVASFHPIKTTAATSAGTREKTMWRSHARVAIPRVRWTRSGHDSLEWTYAQSLGGTRLGLLAARGSAIFPANVAAAHGLPHASGALTRPQPKVDRNVSCRHRRR
jgi:hypothetical protein